MEKAVICIGALIRVICYYLQFKPSLRYMDSPYTSFKTYSEGLAYLSHGLSPYFEGSPVHSPPIILYLYSYASHHVIFVVLSLIDVYSSYLILKLTKVMPTQEKSSMILYYLNPFSLYMSLNLSAAPLGIFVILLFVNYTMARRRIRAAFVLSLIIYLDPSAGIIAGLWYFQHFTIRIYLHSACMMIVLVLTSNILAGHDWMYSCQFASFFLTEVQPSFGLRWYLMLEMFKKYHMMYSVFIAVLPIVYVYPLHSILQKFYKYTAYSKIAELYTAILMAVIYINHPHPTLYEYFVVISLLIPHSSLILEVKSAFFTASSWAIGVVLSAFMWEMWTKRIGGNSNFFYFQTIFGNLVAIGFIVGLLYKLADKTNSHKRLLRCKSLLTEHIQKVTDSFK